jgi:hypothetical protein
MTVKSVNFEEFCFFTLALTIDDDDDGFWKNNRVEKVVNVYAHEVAVG